MGKFLKKSRLVMAVVLLIQALTMFGLFLYQFGRRRSLASALGAIAAFEAAAGGYLIWQWTEDEKDRKEKEALAEEMRANPETFTVPLDEDADEKEFK